MSMMNEGVIEQAIAWHEALKADDADWDAYMQWLEADSSHRVAYDQIMLAEDAVDRNRERIAAILQPEVTAPVSWWSRRKFALAGTLGGALAASIALLIAVPSLRQPADTIYESGATASRTIALADGSTIILAPKSRMTAEGGDQSRLALASGAAYFDIRHDPQRTLSITANGYEVSDIGTKFAIDLAGSKSVHLSVSEGVVSFTVPEQGKVSVGAGYQIFARDAGTVPQPVRVNPDNVGGWRQGRLV